MLGRQGEYTYKDKFSSVQSLSSVQLFVAPWTAATRPPCPSPTSGAYSNSCPLSHWCHPTISSSVTCSPPTFSLAQHHGLFQWVGFSHQVAKALELQLQHQFFQWTFRIDFLFKIDWFDFLEAQGTLKSLLQHHSSKASILQCSAFFIVQLLHPYTTTGKTIALTRWTFVGKVISLLFNMLSRFVIASLPRSKHLLISWLQLPSAVILEPKKIKLFPLFPYLSTTKWWDQMPWS